MKNKIASKDFRVTPGEKVNLKKWPTRVKPFCESNKRYRKLLKEQVEALNSLQRLHYASIRYALLLIFQAMDAVGKDGAIRHVMSGVNPQGCQVFSFKQPSAEELDHDFLWRTTDVAGAEDGVSQDDRETARGIEIHPQTALKSFMEKLIVFDLDRTLAESKASLDTEMAMRLNRIGVARLIVPEHLPSGAAAGGDGPKPGGQG
jgi:hypothetical protein